MTDFVHPRKEILTPLPLLSGSGSVVAAYDSFDGSGALDTNLWDTYEGQDTSGLLTISQTGGRYTGAHSSGDAADTEWFNGDEGRLDYVTFTGDFEFIARGIGLAASPTPDEGDFQFCGILVRLSAGNWEFAVAGNRASNDGNTIEYKTTQSSSSTQNDIGQDAIWNYKADLRVVRSGSDVDFYYQDPSNTTDSWTLLDHDGLGAGRVNFGTGAVQVGLITYGFATVAAFTGECDQVEIPTGTPT